MKSKWEMQSQRYLRIIVLAAILLFFVLYFRTNIPVEQPQADTTGSVGNLERWTVESSAANGEALSEDKSIYPTAPNTDIYDVYISVFPTEDANGKMLDFSAFGLHHAGDHSYNPELDCNIQILKEGGQLDPLTSLDSKNAMIRVRGNSSRGSTYKSYKIKLAKESTLFFGQSVLNINKHSQDVTKIATKLETDLLTKAGNITSYQTHFMRVWIRDTSLPKSQQKFRYYGLFTQTEQPNKKYLEKRGLSSNASLYKARDFSFRMNEALKSIKDPTYDKGLFEEVLSIREASDHTKLLEMVQAVNNTDRSFEEIFNTYFNEENYLTWLAFNLLVGNNDIINHNFILYNPNNSMTWYILPWDFDGTLRFGEYESSRMKLPPSLRGIQKLNQSVLHRRYLRQDGSIEKIEKKMDELLKTVVTRERVEEMIQSYRPVLEKTVTLEPDLSLLEMSPPQLSQYLDRLYDGILSNREAFDISLEYPAPMYVAVPQKRADGSCFFSWEPSYSYQGRPITYTVRVFDDFMMTKPVFEQREIVDTSYVFTKDLKPGVYYLKVTAVDSKGHEQLCMERFETMLTPTKKYNVNGLLEFTIE